MPRKIQTKSSEQEKSFRLSQFFLILGTALFFFSIGIYAATYVTAGKQEKQEEKQKIEKMTFVQEVRNGSMVPLEGKTDTFDLSVRNDNDFINYAASAPTDIAGRVSIKEFLDIWDTYLSENLPTATLVIYHENGKETVTIGQLQKAAKHGEKNRIDYTFRLLQTEELANLSLSQKPHQQPTDKFPNATLFIESPTHDLSGGSLISILQEVQ